MRLALMAVSVPDRTDAARLLRAEAQGRRGRIERILELLCFQASTCGAIHRLSATLKERKRKWPPSRSAHAHSGMDPELFRGWPSA